MTSRTLRRRLQHGDVDGKRNEQFDASGIDGLTEPLLGNRSHQDSAIAVRAVADLWDDEQRQQQLHWTLLFSQLLAQWAQWLASIMLASGSLLGRLFPSSPSQNASNTKLLQPSLSPAQEVRLRHLQQRLKVPFDGSRVEHQDALKQLWRLAYPDRELPSLKSELWKEMGWQGTDPSTDFRCVETMWNMIWVGDSYHWRILSILPANIRFVLLSELDSYSNSLFELLISIEKLEPVIWVEMHKPCFCDLNMALYSMVICLVTLFSQQDSFQRLLHKKDGIRAQWEYPFAVAGINISFMLAQMLELQTGKPTTPAGFRFIELLAEDEMAFDNLYCIAFQMMDAQWLAKRASYMEFNDVLKSTRMQLERELALDDVYSIRDLPGYNLLTG
ncbi:hypothetical protein Tsubulata_004760 [Turnera subulata]|uniref:ELMO domain-containing protein n=1 Tax=Turnera subulata TaxID=218843 RepID=A0A9Q0FFN2_9ROSI|nr:hypothetical protein Tsubulata_004760 [Turnera subulata]